jgi:thymidylate synthase (FAD)
MELVSQEVMDFTRDEMMTVYSTAWGVYQALLVKGVAKEVARVVLPVGTYSTVMMSLNLRSLMNVLSLRISAPNMSVPSYPQQEIEELAMKFEKAFCEKVPVTYKAWDSYGRNCI